MPCGKAAKMPCKRLQSPARPSNTLAEVQNCCLCLIRCPLFVSSWRSPSSTPRNTRFGYLVSLFCRTQVQNLRRKTSNRVQKTNRKPTNSNTLNRTSSVSDGRTSIRRCKDRVSIFQPFSLVGPKAETAAASVAVSTNLRMVPRTASDKPSQARTTTAKSASMIPTAPLSAPPC